MSLIFLVDDDPDVRPARNPEIDIGSHNFPWHNIPEGWLQSHVVAIIERYVPVFEKQFCVVTALFGRHFTLRHFGVKIGVNIV